MRKNPHAVALGRTTSHRKAVASANNGRSGGRPMSVANFWKKVQQPADGCWTLTGRTSQPNCYQQISVEGVQTRMAHRVAYELTYGPIAPGLVARHECDNPCCVRPDHLALGTHTDNAGDRERRGRGNHTAARILLHEGFPHWKEFRTRASEEGRSLRWVLEELIRRYVENGLD